MRLGAEDDGELPPTPGKIRPDALPRLPEEPLPVGLEALIELVTTGRRGRLPLSGSRPFSLAFAPVSTPERDLPIVQLPQGPQGPVEQPDAFRGCEHHADIRRLGE